MQGARPARQWPRASIRKSKRGRSIGFRKKKRPCGVSVCTPVDTTQVLYRTVNSEGHVLYRQNFYPVPWQRIGELPVRITEKDLIVYGPHIREIARHPLYTFGVTGEKYTFYRSTGPDATISSNTKG
jgi:hypothetical protein